MAKALAPLVLWLCVAVSHPALSADIRRPIWAELSPAQKQVLSPLEPEWATLDVVRRKNWIAIADRYPKMTPEEQKRVQERMRAWAQLTPQQREAARARYRALSKLPPDKRQELIRQWTESQEAQQATETAQQEAPKPEATPPAEGEVKSAGTPQ